MHDGARRALAVLAATSCVLATAAIAPAWAQEDNQRCEGTVTDHEGKPLAGVTISFLDLDFNRHGQPVKTNKRGKWAHNVLRATTAGGWEISASLEGYKIVRIKAHTTREDGTPVTNHDDYMVGAEQKGLHKVLVPPQARSSATSKGSCVVDFVMAPEASYNEAYQKVRAEKEGQEGKPADTAAVPPVGGVPGTPPAQPAPPQPAHDALNACKSAYAGRDYAAAVEPCRKAVTEKPDSAEAHRYLGSALVQTDNIAEAEPELKKALEIDPAVTGGNFDMAMLFVKKGRLMQSIPYFEKELEANPQSEAILSNLAKVYSETEQTDKAISTGEQLVALAPDNLEYYGMLADAYKSSGNAEKEMETYSRMGAQDPTGKAFYNLGNLMFNKSEMEKAADAYRRALEQAPDNADAHFQLGMSLVNLGKFKEAAAELETFVKLRPNDKRAAEARSMVAELKKMAG
jgi:tetratricopeptide (TPR) repeat protein